MYIVWTNFYSEGWSKTEAATFDEAVQSWRNAMANGNEEVLITELVPVLVSDGRGRRNVNRKFTADEASTIRTRHAAGEPMAALADEYSVAYNTIRSIIIGTTYQKEG